MSSGQTVQLTASNAVTFSAFELYEWHTTQEGTGTKPGDTMNLEYSLMATFALAKGPDAPAGRLREDTHKSVRATAKTGPAVSDEESRERYAINALGLVTNVVLPNHRFSAGVKFFEEFDNRATYQGHSVQVSGSLPLLESKHCPLVRDPQPEKRETHMDLKQAAISLSMMVFVLSSMLGMGLGLRVSEIVAPLRNWRLVTLSLLANFVVMPFVALALARILRLDESMGIGLLLLGLAGGAPFLPKLAQIAKGNLAFAVGLMVLLMVVTVGYLPIVLPMLLPGVSVHPAQIARSLVLLMLLPLGSALAVRAKRPNVAAKIKPVFDKTSNLGLIALMIFQTLFNIRSVLAVFGTGGIFAGVVFLAVGVAAGWALGGSAPGTRSVLGLGTAQRNIAAALVVANQSFEDPNVVVMVIVVAIIGLVILMPLARALGQRAPAAVPIG